MAATKIRTMEEFSAASGISRPTVSRYFNDPTSVRVSTREKIERALARFDYHPNMFARNLNRKNPRNIGIIVPQLVDPFFAEVVRRIELRCAQAGYWAIVLSSHGERTLEVNALDTLRSLKISGAIVAPLGEGSDARRIEALGREVPVVFLDSRVGEGAPFVGTDNAQSISLIVDYLCRSGEPPCYLDMPRVNQNTEERRSAYVAAMDRLGLEPRIVELGEHQGWSFEEIGHGLAGRILRAGGFPTKTVLCANDRLAIGVLAAAYAEGVKVGIGPGCELRVAGHDDHPLSRFTCPALTTVAQDYDGLASHSLEMLFDRIEGQRSDGGGPEQTLLEARLIMRASA
ncbi:LacI family transcriptional regulator [Amaricoccus solimangrovi]|uniref:LacI family transcriptional regulator n=2 Tax=Amaricoccus solimangrovi TaxID=2589815 RepID=A0A501WDX7_9RHOB|nr:LacI family transcriptional regulator [Amaricoccus solimangrovi]